MHDSSYGRREHILDFLPKRGMEYKPFPGATPVDLTGDPVVRALTDAGYLRVAFAERMLCDDGDCKAGKHFNFAVGLIDASGRTTIALLANGGRGALGAGRDACVQMVHPNSGLSDIFPSVQQLVEGTAGLFVMDRLIARSAG